MKTIVYIEKGQRKFNKVYPFNSFKKSFAFIYKYYCFLTENGYNLEFLGSKHIKNVKFFLENLSKFHWY